MKYKNIILDLAGVVLNLDLERDSRALNAVGLPPFPRFPDYPEMSVPAMKYLNGLMPVDEFLVRVKPFCKPGMTDEQLLWAMDAVLDIIPKERFDFLIGLHNIYNVYLLSNIYESAWQYVLGLFRDSGHTLDECFHKVFLSYELGLAKPDQSIFQAVIDHTGIIPEETLFLDDGKANVDSAAQMGFHAVLVPNNKLEETLSGIISCNQ